MKNLSKISGLLSLAIIVFINVNCNNNKYNVDAQELVCGVKDPVKELKWLNKEFKLLTGGPELNGIVLYEFEGEPVIEIQSSVFSSFNQHQYYCNGDKLDLDAPGAFSTFKKERKEIRMLYGTKWWQ